MTTLRLKMRYDKTTNKNNKTHAEGNFHVTAESGVYLPRSSSPWDASICFGFCSGLCGLTLLNWRLKVFIKPVILQMRHLRSAMTASSVEVLTLACMGTVGNVWRWFWLPAEVGGACLLESGRWRLGLLLHTVQSTGQPPLQRNHLP